MAAAAHRTEVVVAGGGHAGCEAALAAARIGAETLLVTGRLAGVGELSCNPAVGGLGKSQLTAEVDALGGLIGRAADLAAIQYRVLNRRKGPAVRALRAQVDRTRYAAAVRAALEAQPGLTVIEAEALGLLVSGGRACGLATTAGEVAAGAVILCPGTFLRGLIHEGLAARPGGRRGDSPSRLLAESLAGAGLPLGRLKTGTPARLDGRTVDYARLEEQPGDARHGFFSWRTRALALPQVSCWVTRTNEATHRLIRGALDRSPLYTGKITGIGPRYCPSIEDKVMRFPDRTGHHVFLEPEGLETDQLYANGVSTSLPPDVQLAFLRTLPGLEAVEMVWPGYGIEYDFVDPRGLAPTLEWRALAGLYLAGQVNGTSGYEEAAAQGLVAGANAALALRGRPPMQLARDEAFAGIMIDDLTRRGVDEPYRMFTARAEHRIRLRADTAAARLTRRGRELGLVSEEQLAACEARAAAVAAERRHLARLRIRPTPEVQARLAAADIAPLVGPVGALELLARPGIDYALIAELAGGEADMAAGEALEGDLKYRGYEAREAALAERMRTAADLAIPPDLDLARVAGLRRETVERLRRERPGSLAQAAALTGMTPAALAVLEAAIRRHFGGRA